MKEQDSKKLVEFDQKRPFQCVGIIGLGLIGGSIAKALHYRAHVPVIGLDKDRAVIEQAKEEGVLANGAVLGSDDASVWQLLEPCDLVFICTPAELVSQLVHQVADCTRALITDVASIKSPIMKQVSPERFIGGHPMAGSERQGYAFSSELLLENAMYVLCLHDDTLLPYGLVRRFETLIRLMGATPIHLDADTHDRAVAAVSHLPHVLASALSLLAAYEDKGTLSRLAAGGFRDITRIASSDPGLWTGISLESRDTLLPILDTYRSLLEEYTDAIRTADRDKLYRLFYQAAQYRNNLPVDGRGALAAHSTLTVYVDDKPGVLGRVTTLLGNHGINISNIRIRELRAYEGGCLQLVLPDGRQAVKAAWILKEAGYECD